MTIDESEIERRKSVDINILLVLQDFRNGARHICFMFSADVLRIICLSLAIQTP